MEDPIVSTCLRLPFWVAVSILATSLFAGPLANAATIWRANWRVEGYVGQAPAGIKPEAHVVLQYNGKDYPFDLTETVLISGHVPQGQLLNAIERHQMRLLLRGKAEVLDRLRTASPGEKLLIFGHHDTASRDMQVTKISAASPESVPAAK
jgi:hypothetical protein